MRFLAFALLSILAACQVPGTDGFGTAAGPVRTYAPAGTSLQTATVHGQVSTSSNEPNLTVACVTTETTLVASKVTNGTYSLALPAQPGYESDTVNSFHEIWWLVLFEDHNGNGIFNGEIPAGKSAAERDVEIPIIENYHLAYKGYVSKASSPIFLPHNDLAQGWIVVLRTGGQQAQYHQDFTRDFNITESAYWTNRNYQ